jgi:hypothetical protein
MQSQIVSRSARAAVAVLMFSLAACTAASAQTIPCPYGYKGTDNAVLVPDQKNTKPLQPSPLHLNRETLPSAHDADVVSVTDLREEKIPSAQLSEDNVALRAGTSIATPHARQRMVVIPPSCMNVTIKSFTKPCNLRNGYMICDRVKVNVSCTVTDAAR